MYRFLLPATLLFLACVHYNPQPPKAEAAPPRPVPPLQSRNSGPLQPCTADEKASWARLQQRLGAQFHNIERPDVDPWWNRKKTAKDGLLDFLRASNSNWIPLPQTDEYPRSRLPKQTLCGTLRHYAYFELEQILAPDEHDWNMLIEPDEEFGFLVDRAWTKDANLCNWWPNELSTWPKDRPRCRREKDGLRGCFIEAELTPHKLLRNRADFVFPTVPKRSSLLLEERVCVSGVWVKEKLHGYRPEIHPIEAAWWRTSSGSLGAVIVQDASRRFDGTDPTGFITFAPPHAPTEKIAYDYWVWDQLIGRLEVGVKVPAHSTKKVAVGILEEHGLQPARNCPALEPVRDGDSSLEVRSERLCAAMTNACTEGDSILATITLHVPLVGGKLSTDGRGVPYPLTDGSYAVLDIREE